jgi:sugar-specific transcriptional regulator TrmB
MNNDEAIENLVGLGLSFLQAKIYVALLNAGSKPISVKAISSLAKVVRQDTYRVIAVLQSRGLVEKILDNPNTYRCTPIKSEIAKLLKQKKEEYYRVKNKTELMLKNYDESNNMQKHQDDNFHFLLTSNTELLMKKISREISKTNTCIKMIYQLERMSVIAFYLCEDFRKAIQRGIKIHLITSPLLHKEMDKNLRTLQEINAVEKNLEIKYIKEFPNVGLTIFDDAKCFIRTGSSIGHSICTSNTNFVKLAEIFFKNLWEEDSAETNLLGCIRK